MKFIGIIPARYASTRFPGKPLADIHGKTMIQRVYEQTLLAIDEVWVATDDDRIQKAVENFGGNVIMTSPDHQSGTDRIAEALSKISESKGTQYDVVINIQGDEPFIQPEQIELVKKCFESEQTQIATLVKQISNQEEIFDPNKVKAVISKSQKALYFSRSPIPYLRGVEKENWLDKGTFYKHIGMYAYKNDVLKQITQIDQSSLELSESLEQLRWLENGYWIQTEVTKHESIGIDTPEDLERVKEMGLL
ncbi:3-deoxy-manno-octulosonate cytidylyltransferase [Marinifilum caeruleilacunae]|uniref:3-deoxy-manno-octulosonate cytidylyltransferase n=1 Tax=Marinifilum caeruleilacunae TaxID=2499076 RepID=A0ABX1WZR9_9BACT|nr:3-deoxy-manno-octulosonate cytidylyltransferase [Marinifilum caeruleilacunae]NOU61631.1 3-deoxy-manno-octulosonate cytidylyltransferase [Marinifilum caeruleilacunae]